ncbi:MAG: DUF1559 domain-containing protein [Mariniblastus sp.]|nr:DUF1559 domain-containing protein [Mariniblastus sp.]
MLLKSFPRRLRQSGKIDPRASVSTQLPGGSVSRSGLTRIDLLAVIICLALVVMISLPKVVQMRGESRRTACLNNLGDAALGTLNYESDSSLTTNTGEFPALALAPADLIGTPQACDVSVPSWSWQVVILPYMGAEEVYDQLQPVTRTAADFVAQAVTPEGQALQKAVQQPLFVCPEDQGPLLNEARWLGPIDAKSVDAAGVLQVARGNYIGVNALGAATSFVNLDPLKYPGIPTPNAGVFEAINQPVELVAITDGTSNTFMIGERAWNYQADGQVYPSRAATQLLNRSTRLPAGGYAPCGAFGVGNSDTAGASNFGQGINFPHEDPVQSQDTYSSLHAGGANFAYCDGSTRFVTETIDPVTMMELTAKSDVEVAQDD